MRRTFECIALVFLIGLCGCKTTTSSAAVQVVPMAPFGKPLRVLDETPADRKLLIEAYSESIREGEYKFGDVGSVLEALAVLAVKRIYPESRYEVVNGIEYLDATGRTMGELDIVILHRETGDAVVVAEVKLSGNLPSAKRKAESQLKRFRDAIAAKKVDVMLRRQKPLRAFDSEDFEDVKRYAKIGSKGALEAGFDWEIDLARDEGDELQKKVLGWKKSKPMSSPMRP